MRACLLPRTQAHGDAGMDDQLRNETRIAVARIDALLEKTGRLLDQIAAGESLPASAGIQRDEMLGLDSYLKALAPRLYGGPVAERVWEPPGGKAFDKSRRLDGSGSSSKRAPVRVERVSRFFQLIPRPTGSTTRRTNSCARRGKTNSRGSLDARGAEQSASGCRHIHLRRRGRDWSGARRRRLIGEVGEAATPNCRWTRMYRSPSSSTT